jgi:ABC-type polysaccharide transport system permease subunit
MVGIVIQFLAPGLGILARILRSLGIGADRYMGDPRLFKHIYVWSGIWQNLGWGSIVYLAALSSIDPELHEAARIDGASRIQRILHIDVPGILPTAIILLILNAGRVMNLGFEKVFLMQNPLNINSSEIITTYVYKVGLASEIPNYSYATAIGLFNAVVNLILILSVNRAARRVGGTSLW